MAKYKSIAFDLDDTLLDTSGLLVPAASRQACELMLAAGLQSELGECLKLRQELALSFSHTEIFAKIAEMHKAPATAKMQDAIREATTKFYNPDIPTTLPLLPGSFENLEVLKKNYQLFLVTMGSHESQARKIKALKIEHYFEKIYILNGFVGEKKDIAFKDILRQQGHEPHQLLSVGNRLSSEIRYGKRTGADTCYFAFGEHLGEKPEMPEDHPDFTVSHHKDLILTCGL